MKEAFSDIQEALKEITGLRYIGEDWGQLNFEQPPVEFPCALIDLAGVEFLSASMGTQQAKAVVNVIVADVLYTGITPNLPKLEKEKAFKIFDLVNEINKRLHGLEGETYSKLCRLSIKKTQRDDTVREFVISYQFSYADSSAAKVLSRLQARPDIKISK